MHFWKFYKIYQYVHGQLFEKYSVNNNKNCIAIRGTFLCYYKDCLDNKRKPIELGKGGRATKIESRMTPAFKFVQTPKKWENVEENVVKKTLLKQPQDIPEVSGTDTAKNY